MSTNWYQKHTAISVEGVLQALSDEIECAKEGKSGLDTLSDLYRMVEHRTRAHAFIGLLEVHFTGSSESSCEGFAGMVEGHCNGDGSLCKNSDLEARFKILVDHAKRKGYIEKTWKPAD